MRIIYWFTYIVLCVLGMQSVPAFAQTYLTDIAEKCCECVDQVPDSIQAEAFTFEVGICMFDAATPYKKQLWRDHRINMSNMAEAGEALGELIGVKMATVCPDLLMEMVNRVRTNDEAPEETDEKTLTGVITKVEQEGFVTFSIKDESGKTSKLYWMELVTSGIDLVNMFPQMTGRTVDVTYVTREFFDPRIGEYRVFLVIKSLEWSTR